MINNAQVTPWVRGQPLTYERLRGIAALAMAAGVRQDVYRDGLARPMVRWDISGRCEEPRTLELHSTKSVTGAYAPLTVVLETRCRRCGWCRIQRRHLWAGKALTEYRDAVRTWFLTLTLSPNNHHLAQLLAQSACGKRGLDFEGLSEVEKFAERVKACGPELTRFIKRVRKNSGARVRYLLVAEAHESGLPHFHMLLHEVDEAAPVRKAVIKAAWRVGFMKAALVEEAKGAVYLCKYLAKDSRTRVRCSFRYGLSQPLGKLDLNQAGPRTGPRLDELN